MGRHEPIVEVSPGGRSGQLAIATGASYVPSMGLLGDLVEEAKARLEALELEGVRVSRGERVRRLGLSDRWLLVIEERGSGTRVKWPGLGGAWEERDVASVGALNALWPDLEPAVRAAARRLTVYALVPGRRYRVVEEFDDHYGNRFEAGAELTFEGSAFLPYHDGHTIRFVERTMYLQGESDAYARFGWLVEPA